MRRSRARRIAWHTPQGRAERFEHRLKWAGFIMIALGWGYLISVLVRVWLR